MTDNLNIKPENQSQHNQSKPLTDDQEIDAFALAQDLYIGGHKADPHTGEILPREDGTEYKAQADNWLDYSEPASTVSPESKVTDEDELPDSLPAQFMQGQHEQLLDDGSAHDVHAGSSELNVMPKKPSWFTKTFMRSKVDEVAVCSTTISDDHRTDLNQIESATCNSTSEQLPASEQQVISPDSYLEHVSSLHQPEPNAENQDALPQSNLTPHIPAPASKLSLIATIVALTLSTTAVGVSGYQIYLTRHSVSAGSLVDSLEAKMTKRIEQVTDAMSVNAVNQQQVDNTLTLTLQRLETDLKSGLKDLDNLKNQTSKMHEDVAIGMQTAEQSKALTEQLSRTIATLNESLTATATEVSLLKRNRPSVTSKVSTPAAEVAASVGIIPSTPVKKPAKVYRRPAPQPSTPVTPTSVTTLNGYKLFSVDDWGGVLLVTMTQGEEVQRLQVGDFLQDWRVDTVDLNNKSVVFVKGAMRTTVIASGG